MNRTSLCSLVAPLAGLGLIVALGCSDDGLEKRYPVSGTVTYKGKPVEGGVVQFAPEGSTGRAASGTIEGGSYVATTLTPEDGMIPGKYTVSIISKDYDEKIASASAPIGPPEGRDVGRANRLAKSRIPEKYAAAATSGLEIEVKPERNVLDFDLKD